MEQDTVTFYFFARPSFVDGMARILDFGLTMQDYNRSRTVTEADYIAISNDWQAVGKDIKTVLSRYEQEK